MHKRCDSSLGSRIAVLLRRIREAAQGFRFSEQYDSGESLLGECVGRASQRDFETGVRIGRTVFEEVGRVEGVA